MSIPQGRDKNNFGSLSDSHNQKQGTPEKGYKKVRLTASLLVFNTCNFVRVDLFEQFLRGGREEEVERLENDMFW